MNILGTTFTTPEAAAAWAASRGAAPVFVDLAALYWRFGPERGVKPEVAYGQSAKETGFGYFGGVITAQYRNPCGLKTASGGQNDDEAAHQRFPTWEVGVQAHLDHLALYAGALGYPRPASPDPRHFAGLLGTAERVEALSGKWAGAGYGQSVVDDYIVPLLAFELPAPAPEPESATAADLAIVAGELEEAKRVLGEVHRAIVDAGNRLTQSV